MKFDLTKLDFSLELTQQLKKQHYDIVNEMIKTGAKDNEDNKKITLFHGTSLKYFNNILLMGLQPRDVTRVSNYKDELSSIEGLVYLTSKWHYWYAFNTVNRIRESGDEEINIPCYVDIEVSSNDLILDEDFFHSRYVLNAIKNCARRHSPVLELSYEECISQYATIAHIGAIPKEKITNLTILASAETMNKNFINPNSQYMKDLKKWANGRGKGKLRKMDLFEIEDHKYNLIFNLKDIPHGYIIDKIQFDREMDTYRLSFNKKEV